ncbi:hypothetical protein CR159_20555 [Pollutimonas subterranea]|uniref:Uncharacterized protein n=1 Tax=Pollutimonas subterranea TaxID=2045210 RepID=A0A2N4TZ03_9BURK|nr:hypothetical protein CR159_20555 [Pollutimonas subterranea]
MRQDKYKECELLRGSTQGQASKNAAFGCYLALMNPVNDRFPVLYGLTQVENCGDETIAVEDVVGNAGKAG